MKLYKLTDQNMQTHKGCQWVIGEKKIATGKSDKPCTDGVLHAYADPRLAVIFNPIHASIPTPRIFIIDTDDYIDTDGKKCWSKSQTIVSEIRLPSISLDQKVEFAIRCALVVYKKPQFVAWANNWIQSLDRTDAAYAAANAAAYAAANAAAAYAANDAAYAAANAAADAASAAYAAAAAYAARAAANAANDAAYAAANAAAAYAARAAYANIDFVKILDIMGIPK